MYIHIISEAGNTCNEQMSTNSANVGHKTLTEPI